MALSPNLDTRSGDKRIHSKAGTSIKARKINPDLLLFKIPAGVKTIYLDELQFFRNVKAFIGILQAKEINFVAAGLDLDCLCETWPEMDAIKGCDGITFKMLTARCTPCGKGAAVYTRRLIPFSSVSLIDPGNHQYVPTCESCWAAPPLAISVAE